MTQRYDEVKTINNPDNSNTASEKLKVENENVKPKKAYSNMDDNMVTTINVPSGSTIHIGNTYNYVCTIGMEELENTLKGNLENAEDAKCCCVIL